MKALLNLPLQHIAAPAVVGTGLGVQQYQIHRLHLGQQGAHVPPRHLSHGLWDNFKLRAKEGIKLPHGKQAGARKAFHARVAGLQILCHLLHHRRTPGALTLPGIQLPANVPIQAQQFGIHRQHGASLRALDALLDGRQRQAVIAVVGDIAHVMPWPPALRSSIACPGSVRIADDAL